MRIFDYDHRFHSRWLPLQHPMLNAPSIYHNANGIRKIFRTDAIEKMPLAFHPVLPGVLIQTLNRFFTVKRDEIVIADNGHILEQLSGTRELMLAAAIQMGMEDPM